MSHDLVLSGGYLAFGRQAGFLAAIEDRGITIDAVCGTSSGALAGGLWAAGMPAARIFEELTVAAPVRRLRPNRRPWRGLFSLRTMIRELRDKVPSTFEDLPRPFAAGVMAADGSHRLLTSGPLPEAIAASCALPYLFEAVRLGEELLRDGGAVDRVGLDPWRRWRPDAVAVVHIVESTKWPAKDPDGLPFVRTPRSGASIFGFGDVAARFAETRADAARQLIDQGL